MASPRSTTTPGARRPRAAAQPHSRPSPSISTNAGMPWLPAATANSTPERHRLGPAAAPAQRAHAQHQRAHRRHPAGVLGGVHVQVAVQLVVDQHQHQQRQQRRGVAQTQLPAQRPQPTGEADGDQPQQRAHGRQRRRADQVAHPGLVAVQDHLADGGRVGRTPLQRLVRNAAGVGDLEPVLPVAPRPEHAEVEQRREAQAHQREQQHRGQAGARQPGLGDDLVAQRRGVGAQAVAADGVPPERRPSRPRAAPRR